jgi:hypothetical protein
MRRAAAARGVAGCARPCTRAAEPISHVRRRVTKTTPRKSPVSQCTESGRARSSGEVEVIGAAYSGQAINVLFTMTRLGLRHKVCAKGHGCEVMQ